MLPQELNADVHQFHRIQGGTPHMGIVGCMGGNAGEGIFHLHTGSAGTDLDFIGVTGMPGQSSVQIPEHTVPCHKGLACAALLAGAAIKNDRPVEQPRLDGLFHCQRRTEGCRTQQVVTAALTVATGIQALPLCAAGALIQTGQGIKLTQNADSGLSRTKGAGKGGGNAAQLSLHLEALLLQQVAVVGGGLVFFHGQLRKIPDGIAERGDFFGIFIHTII